MRVRGLPPNPTVERMETANSAAPARLPSATLGGIGDMATRHDISDKVILQNRFRIGALVEGLGL
jgi:hypothetical protein